MSCNKGICTFAKCLNFTAMSENQASMRKWWFADKNGNLVSSAQEEGMTDDEALKWLLDENIKGMQRIREKLKKIEEG